MAKNTPDEYALAVQEWAKSDKTQRLGQFLMNSLQPTQANPKIFYETHNNTAAIKFYEEYVNA